MRFDWSLEEVRATIADYFLMLDAELRGESYSKKEHRQRLKTLLNKRSDGAIERKHQNISAVLIKLGFPYVMGYKPLRNYQSLLFDEVAEQLQTNVETIQIVRNQVLDTAAIPNVVDILGTLVEAPHASDSKSYKSLSVNDRSTTLNIPNYLAMEAQNISLGAAGEEFVVRFEIARLLHLRKEILASQVERVSQSRGPCVGYDVLSFEESGRERIIEVKTTAYGSETPFFVTRNEVTTSLKHDEHYFLYRLFNFRRQPMLFYKRGNLSERFILDPMQYLASIV